ncbi:MAG: acetyl-CoA acetyltransferase [Dehalococcoidia bacterium]
MTTAIVGAAETDEIGVLPGKSAIQLHAEAALNALDDAGLTKDDIDAVLCAGQSPVAVAEYLNIVPNYLDGTSVGGCSFMMHVRHASAAIRAGLCTTALITHGESGRSRVGMGGWGGARQMLQAQFEEPYGVAGPPTRFTIPILRHMHEYGTTHEQMASVAVATRRWAEQNPRAMMREPITVEDVLNSRVIAWPVHLLECCLVTDGGGALVVVAAERAKDFPKKPAYVLGTGESSEHSMISQMIDMTESRAFKVSGDLAFNEAGISRKDIDHAMFYDAFAHTPMFALEALGFVGKGESGPFFEEMRTAPGGDFPLNTNGGGLSYTHTGMYGMFAIQESVRQLRGQAAAQLPGVRTSIAHGVGGMFSAAGTLILTNEGP